jgi:dCMP deaminase
MNLFESAEYAESISHCTKRPVGAAIELNNRVVSIGWNHGTTEKCNCDKHRSNPDCLHAEAVAFFADDDFCFKGGIIAVTYLPCLNCAKLIVSKGIKSVYYRDHRNDRTQGVEFLKLNNVEVLNEWKI